MILDSDDLIGRAVIYLSDIHDISEDNSIHKPTWYPVRMGFKSDEESMGEILVSFAKVPSDFEFKSLL
jgi:hypothetical protein